MSEILKTVNRREALELLGNLGLLSLFVSSLGIGACDDGSATCASPDETDGPYPDKLGMIDDQKYYRQDITEGKAGLPLSLILNVVDANNGCAAVPNATVEIWQCDVDGHYSEYVQQGYDGTGQTFLRGLQVADSSGQVTFTTIYPGWYQGRVSHIHVFVYVDGKQVKTTQMAFPDEISSEVYKVAPYAAKGQNPMKTEDDNVFSDGYEDELLEMTGDTTNGYVGTLSIGVEL